jgi:hypothetical protein
MKISLGVFAVLLITGSIFRPPMPNPRHRDPIAQAASRYEWKTAPCRPSAELPTEGNRGHPSRISIGVLAISRMTMARLHAIARNQWRPTVRIAGKNILASAKRSAGRGCLVNAAFVAERRLVQFTQVQRADDRSGRVVDDPRRARRSRSGSGCCT